VNLDQACFTSDILSIIFFARMQQQPASGDKRT